MPGPEVSTELRSGARAKESTGTYQVHDAPILQPIGRCAKPRIEPTAKRGENSGSGDFTHPGHAVASPADFANRPQFGGGAKK